MGHELDRRREVGGLVAACNLDQQQNGESDTDQPRTEKEAPGRAWQPVEVQSPLGQLVTSGAITPGTPGAHEPPGRVRPHGWGRGVGWHYAS